MQPVNKRNTLHRENNIYHIVCPGSSTRLSLYTNIPMYSYTLCIYREVQKKKTEETMPLEVSTFRFCSCVMLLCIIYTHKTYVFRYGTFPVIVSDRGKRTSRSCTARGRVGRVSVSLYFSLEPVSLAPRSLRSHDNHFYTTTIT